MIGHVIDDEDVDPDDEDDADAEDDAEDEDDEDAFRDRARLNAVDEHGLTIMFDGVTWQITGAEVRAQLDYAGDQSLLGSPVVTAMFFAALRAVRYFPRGKT